jgi:hypothetical protein
MSVQYVPERDGGVTSVIFAPPSASAVQVDPLHTSVDAVPFIDSVCVGAESAHRSPLPVHVL